MSMILLSLLHILQLVLIFSVLVGIILTSVFIELLLFGSTVDPDDNGMLRTKAQKEKYRQKKLAKRSDYVR